MKNSFQNRNKPKFVFIFWILGILRFCCFRKVKRQKSLFDKGSKRMDKHLDIIRIQRRLKENSIQLLALIRDQSTHKLSKFIA